MKLAITGPNGFIAWHTRAAVYSATGSDAIHIGRDEFAHDSMLDAALLKADAVIHLAGVNRSSSDEEVAEVNPLLAQKLVAGLERTGRRIPVVYGNSIQSEGDSDFGGAKRAAGEILSSWGKQVGAPVIDMILPNIFGEGCRPFYNSVTATFSHQLARGESPQVKIDREIPLLHVQRAAAAMISAANIENSMTVRPQGHPVAVSELRQRLMQISTEYRTGDLPDLSDPFTRDLFNTYRSYTFPDLWPMYPPLRGDQRGALHEAVRARGGEAQVFFSTTKPGFTRGQHFHLRKVERFVVVRGKAMIRLRRLFDREVIEFSIEGDKPALLDMPTMWVHSITNIGDNDLITLFYADEVFDPETPDTFPEEV